MGCGIVNHCSGTKGYGSRMEGAFAVGITRSGVMGKAEAETGMIIPEGGRGLEEVSLGDDATDRRGVGPAGP